MALLTTEAREKLEKFPLYSQDDKGVDAICSVRFFLPGTRWIWYVLEADMAYEEFFGIACGIEVEYGYFTLGELENLVVFNTLTVVADTQWEAKKLCEIDDPRLQDFLHKIYSKDNKINI